MNVEHCPLKCSSLLTRAINLIFKLRKVLFKIELHLFKLVSLLVHIRTMRKDHQDGVP